MSLRAKKDTYEGDEGDPCLNYENATPESIRKHIGLLSKIITRRTDAEIYTPTEKDDA